MKAEPANDEEVRVDASNLRHFDSSALAVLLECERAAVALGKRFVLRDLPERLRSLAHIYGVEPLLYGGSGGLGGSRGAGVSGGTAASVPSGSGQAVAPTLP